MKNIKAEVAYMDTLQDYQALFIEHGFCIAYHIYGNMLVDVTIYQHDRVYCGVHGVTLVDATSFLYNKYCRVRNAKIA